MPDVTKPRELAHVVCVGPPCIGVVDVVEPDGGVRDFCELVELRSGERPGLSLNPRQIRAFVSSIARLFIWTLFGHELLL